MKTELSVFSGRSVAVARRTSAQRREWGFKPKLKGGTPVPLSLPGAGTEGWVGRVYESYDNFTMEPLNELYQLNGLNEGTAESESSGIEPEERGSSQDLQCDFSRGFGRIAQFKHIFDTYGQAWTAGEVPKFQNSSFRARILGFWSFPKEEGFGIY